MGLGGLAVPEGETEEGMAHGICCDNSMFLLFFFLCGLQLGEGEEKGSDRNDRKGVTGVGDMSPYMSTSSAIALREQKRSEVKIKRFYTKNYIVNAFSK